MLGFLREYQSAFEFVGAQALFALSTFVALWAGMLSFAAVAFGALGGFAAARIDVDHGIPFILSLLIGAAVGGVAALVLSLVLLKLESHWMALATLALILITRVLVLNLPSVTGGSTGMSVPGKANDWWLVGVLLVVGWSLSRLRHSRFGMAATAVREDPNVAAASGIDIGAIRRSAFVASGVLGGLGGVFLANFLRYISPDTFYISLAFTMIAAVVLGGAYHWSGAILGALVFGLLPEFLRVYLAEGDEIVNGFVLLVVMVFLPRGLIDPRRLRSRKDDSDHREFQSDTDEAKVQEVVT